MAAAGTARDQAALFPFQLIPIGNASNSSWPSLNSLTNPLNQHMVNQVLTLGNGDQVPSRLGGAYAGMSDGASSDEASPGWLEDGEPDSG